MLIENAPNINLNALSSSGSAALFYAINHMHLEEAEILLDAGAIPTYCERQDRNPISELKKIIILGKKELGALTVTKSVFGVE